MPTSTVRRFDAGRSRSMKPRGSSLSSIRVMSGAREMSRLAISSVRIFARDAGVAGGVVPHRPALGAGREHRRLQGLTHRVFGERGPGEVGGGTGSLVIGLVRAVERRGRDVRMALAVVLVELVRVPVGHAD